MRPSVGLLLGGAVLLATAPAHGAPDFKLCEDIAARLRADRDFSTAGSELLPLEALSRGAGPYAEIAVASRRAEIGGDADSYMKMLDAEFHPAPALAAAMKTLDYGYDEVWSLSGSEVHALTGTAGSAHCSEFLFFEGGRLLPDPPRALDGGMSEDAGSRIAECYHSGGTLARLGGQIAFVATDVAFEDYGMGMRVAALDRGRWDKTCGVSADFETLYRVKKVFVAKDGPLSREMLAKLIPEIVRAKDKATTAKTKFAFGPPLPENAFPAGMTEAANDGKLAFDGTLPLFGAEDRDDNLFLRGDTETVGVVLEGRPYLLRIVHPTIGWRDLLGYLLAFYRIDGGKPVAVASAVVGEDRGPLTAVRVRALRP